MNTKSSQNRFLTALSLTLLIAILTACGSSATTPLANTPTPPTVSQASVESVQVEVGVGSPIPVHIVVNGSLPDTCAQLEYVEQRLQGSEIQVSIRATQSGDANCAAASLPFTARLPINVVNLPAGAYTVSVNGVRADFNLVTGNANGQLPSADAEIIKDDIQVDDVSVVVEGGSAVKSVRLIISGQLPGPCSQLGEIRLHREDEAFYVRLIAYRPASEVCLLVTLPFRLEIPLNLTNLPAATYVVNVNGVTTSFDPRTAPAPDATGDLRLVPVENVQVQVGVGSPIPVDVFVSGTWPDLCAQLAETKQRLASDKIEITLLATPADPNCPPDHLGLPFRIALPLNVVELPVGNYEVVVNGVSTTFDWQKGASMPTMPLQSAAKVDHVGMEIGVGSPIPVNVVVSGNFPDTCAQLGTITQQRVGSDIQITLLTESPAAGKECLQDSLPFRMNIPLNIVGLPEGTYNVTVNDASTTFAWPPQPGP